MNEQDYDVEDYGRKESRTCSHSCPHYDSLNRCCWQATETSLCFDVSEGDYCHLDYEKDDER